MNQRIKNLEFRWNKKFHDYPEIVCWHEDSNSREYCYSLLYWIKGKEGWDVHFVGSRPFDSSKFDERDLWALMRYGQQIADASYELFSRDNIGI